MDIVSDFEIVRKMEEIGAPLMVIGLVTDEESKIGGIVSLWNPAIEDGVSTLERAEIEKVLRRLGKLVSPIILRVGEVKR